MRNPNAIKNKYGRTCFVRWGRMGGNPILLKQRRYKKR